MIRAEWQTFPNTNTVSLHTDRGFPRVKHGSQEAINENDLSDEGRKLSELLGCIHGLVAFSSIEESKYSINFTKGIVFEWSELEPRIVDLVGIFFGDELVLKNSAGQQHYQQRLENEDWNKKLGSCFVCDREFDRSLKRGPKDYPGVLFDATGNWGSTIYDPTPDKPGHFLRIRVCDLCVLDGIEKIAEKGDYLKNVPEDIRDYISKNWTS